MITQPKFCCPCLKVWKIFIHFCKTTLASQRQAASLKIILQQPAKEGGDIHFIAQLMGKNLFPRLSATEIFQDKSLFNEFSEDDQKRIAYAYEHKQLLPMETTTPSNQRLCKLFSIEPERDSQKKIFKIEFLKDGIPHLKRLSTEDIHANKHILSHLSKEDVYHIGFHAGQESLDIKKNRDSKINDTH
jgi:hypothetical protein